MNTDLEEQDDELLAMQSIFGSEEFFREESKSAGEIRVSVELPAGYNVALKDGETKRQYDISFLPPLLLNFELPADYPSSSPPSFTLTCSWLTHAQLVSLSAQLADLYQATGGAVVLFSWIQFLREDALKFLDIHTLLELPSNENSTLQHNQDKQDAEASEAKDDEHSSKSEPTSDQCGNVSSGEIQQSMPISEGDSRENVLSKGGVSASVLHPPSSVGSLEPSEQEAASLPLHATELSPNKISLTPSQMLMSQILIHDATQKQKVFASTVFDCGVCYIGWLGSECVQLYECGHIFCQACLREFCKVQIAEGNIRSVTCPQAGCTATPTPSQVKSLIGEELFSRYDRLLLQSTLDSMSDVTYCPRNSCGSAVILEKSSTVALCSVCSFAFCVDCKKAYHGASKCYEDKIIKQKHDDGLQNLPQTDEGLAALLEDYNTGSKQRRHLLESRYGRKMFVSTLNSTLSERWKADNTKPCPHCFCPIEKDGGCDHMYCTQCRQPFYWF
ncbi:E3 ubiquitin-protein ligase RNF14-like [Melanotaenia boesemani]|uniref:E3 ubiquitin-protein ligase RNF14-like n=1 Tax=Melanotaenia boesemani TaxID=1250792 RepID=UPI001C04BFC1|nr:E3 ubiquitin-protein ligase RNF14-like [Melanotaenia boesemani]